MRISEIGELSLVEIVRDRLSPGGARPSRAGLWTRPESGPGLLLGVGDDAAAWWADGRLQVATTDTMIEDVHFRRAHVTGQELGWKALAISVSDVAAMGGQPRYALLNLGLPGETDVAFVQALYEGLLAVAERFGLAIAGGDTVSAPVITLATTLIGDAYEVPVDESGPIASAECRGAPAFRLLLRSAAKPGDVVAVTGQLGASAAGMWMLLSDRSIPGELGTRLRQAHLQPMPRVEAGRCAVAGGLVCGMDISDGLLIDLGRLAAASGVEARIRASCVPVSDMARAAYPDDCLKLALAGGEDYELILVGPAGLVAKVQAQTSVPVTVIGEIAAGQPGAVKVLDERGDEVRVARSGWEHFRGQQWKNDPSR
ncbi:MAG: thiamine-monophosphate kinase [Chloroflexota bacterium]|nr:MAG: thiamine-monophosphate kinase [Chloroflexota bacterium]